MSDPRFARLKTDPRFRKPRRKTNKVVVDDRFKSIFEDGANKSKTKGVKVDKYGKKVSATHDVDNLRRFYRLADDEQASESAKAAPDYARGEVLMESSDEDDEQVRDSESDDGEVVLGRDIRRPISVPDDELEIDLDESQFAELDAQAAANIAETEDTSSAVHSGERTNRLALVNLDWDHVKASHLFKIFSSVLSSPPSFQRKNEQLSTCVRKGKVLHVRVYPSEFGKGRLAQEEKEGPPKELFQKKSIAKGERLGENPPIDEDDGNEYDEEALRKYQLERLRYYYAVIACDSTEAASHIYSELDGTELERSANIFDLSFVPHDMTFNDDFRDEATEKLSGTYKGVEFVTDALRHSKVKLTWDDDDAERNKITRRTLSRKEIEESDFQAYLASSDSDESRPDIGNPETDKRENLRALLLGGNDEDNELLPEGWGQNVDKAGEMEITFTPGLRESKDDENGDETTLQRYVRKQKEKRKMKKLGRVDKNSTPKKESSDAEQDDEFFGEDDDPEEASPKSKPNKTQRRERKSPPRERPASSAAELQLLLTSNNPSHEPKHFDMRSVVKAEKKKKRKNKEKGIPKDFVDDEAQEDFVINVKDDRFKAIHDDPTFAIDPSNPHFKMTKSMVALLEERAKRLRTDKTPDENQPDTQKKHTRDQSLTSLVESVKRKSTLGQERGGKKRKL